MNFEEWPEAFTMQDKETGDYFSIRFDPNNTREKNDEISSKLALRGIVPRDHIYVSPGNETGGRAAEADLMVRRFIGGEIDLGSVVTMSETK